MARETQNPVRVRIAPSPTGPLHVGTARTALFNELFARNQGGAFVMRLEDTDTARSKKEFETHIVEGLRWLGMTWDEGPDVGGPFGPYRQSERKTHYTSALEQLLKNEHAYFCACRLENEGAAIDKTCVCADTQEDILKKFPREQLPIKLRIPSVAITFNDGIRGDITTNPDGFGGDFFIARTLSDPLYHLAVVVDDALMEISHVIRGDDHLSNTAKHIALQRALGVASPVYVHVPLLLNEQRKKLSKRTGETNMQSFRTQGFLPEAMLNYLALLGWSPKNDKEFFSHNDLIRLFSLEGLQPSPAIFSETKLKSMNRHYLRQLSPQALVQAIQPYLGPEPPTGEMLKAALMTEQSRASTLRELAEAIAFFSLSWPGEYAAALLQWRNGPAANSRDRLKKTLTFLAALPAGHFIAATLEAQLLQWIDEDQLGRGDTLWPLRVALTGKANSPGPFEVAAVLGKEETLRRITMALDKLG